MNIFCEDRKRPVTSKESKDYLNQHNLSFKGQGQPGEIYTYQICIHMEGEEQLDHLKLSFSDLVHKDGHVITKRNMTCYNLEGIDFDGRYFQKELSVKGTQVLWLGMKLPKDIAKGSYEGEVGIEGNSQQLATVKINLDIQGEPVKREGVDELWRLSRLKWLNSKIVIDGKVAKGFEPVVITENQIDIKGRRILMDDTSIIKGINSYFREDLSTLNKEPLPILRQGAVMVYKTKESGLMTTTINYELKSSSDEEVILERKFHNNQIEVVEELAVEYDGYMRLVTTVTAKEECTFEDIRFEVPFSKEASQYSMGFGQVGGALRELDYTWNDLHQDSLWVGTVQGGLTCSFRDDSYVPPFVNVYYNQRPRKKPLWDNEGRGKVMLTQGVEGATLSAYTGEMDFQKCQSKTFVVEMMVSPYKLIDYKKHWNTRYFHPHENAEQTDWLKEMEEANCQYINIHHGQELHPFINYPFVENKALKDFIDEAHAKDKKVKLYYTLRELTNHIKELWPFYSLNNEIFPAKETDAVLFWKTKNLTDVLDANLLVERKMWVEENIDEDLIPAWQHDFNHGKFKGQTCASILTNPYSRLNNFYLEGLDWLVKEMDIDGLYIDDVAYGRKTMRRVRKILDQKEDCLIDFHSWNHMNDRAGFANCALLYKELLPYMDSLWFGEGFRYDEVSPEFWLVEVSGIPFGLTGEMLQNDGHVFKGMLFGMSNRSQWGERDPKPIHQLWDQFNIQESRMSGFWSLQCPIKSNQEDVKVTVYIKEDEVLVVLGSWRDEDAQVKLLIDWDILGFRKEEIECKKVAIEGVQEEGEVDMEKIFVPANEGAIITLMKQH